MLLVLGNVTHDSPCCFVLRSTGLLGMSIPDLRPFFS